MTLRDEFSLNKTWSSLSPICRPWQAGSMDMARGAPGRWEVVMDRLARLASSGPERSVVRMLMPWKFYRVVCLAFC